MARSVSVRTRKPTPGEVPPGFGAAAVEEQADALRHRPALPADRLAVPAPRAEAAGERGDVLPEVDGVPLGPRGRFHRSGS
ncbi:hypothetical protein [Streptomyces somaliensis]|uniref:hypothetical protein n=1 Tax=Streptomyces somaliensis TaxID=78355 RepID=UPI0034E97378|nr:hypothetical protein [Streptomyces somaliensis]